MRRCALQFILLLVLASLAIGAELHEAIDRAVQQQMRSQQAVGVAVGIIQGGKVTYTQGYGFEDREAATPVTNDTMFRWASISKPLTAVTAVQLAEAGTLDLDADIRTLVPEFPDKGVPITTRQLLGHVGGIVHYRNGVVVASKQSYDTPHPYRSVILALDRFKESPLVSQPGQAFNYSTHGFILASAAVERAGGAAYAQQVRDRIAIPLGLTSLQPDDQWTEIPHRAVGYRKRLGSIRRSSNTDVSWKLAGGGWISNVKDLAGFAAGLLREDFLSEEAKAQLFTPLTLADGSSTGYGLGFGVGQRQGRVRISHNGSQEKTRTLLIINPEDRSGVVVMTNSEYADPGRIAAAISKAIAAESQPSTP